MSLGALTAPLKWRWSRHRPKGPARATRIATFWAHTRKGEGVQYRIWFSETWAYGKGGMKQWYTWVYFDRMSTRGNVSYGGSTFWSTFDENDMHPMQIAATVIDILRAYHAKYHPRFYGFTAKRRRRGLYLRLMQRVFGPLRIERTPRDSDTIIVEVP